jgi:tyrosyl-tRNA synthetase
MPSDLALEAVSDPRLNRILLATGLAASTSEADRLIKSGAVSVASAGSEELSPRKNPSERIAAGEWILRTGKRWKRISV